MGDLTQYCAQLAEAGVLLLPGSVYDQPGHVRIGFGRANMPDALEVLEANLSERSGTG
jgi:aspartate/methionine/tyrosine aminotransferase